MNFAGVDLSNQAIGVPPSNLSSSVTAGTQQLTVWALSLLSGPASMVSVGPSEPVVAITNQAIAGVKQEMFGGQLFERVIVIPRSKALGFVLSATQFAVEVWNAFRDMDQTLNAIVITGAGGVTIADPFGEPLLYPAMDSYIYQATMPQAGPAQINQSVVFSFASGILGTDLQLTGSRVTVFSVAPDWSQGISETIAYLTDVFVAYSDNEQRRALRQLPRRGLKYRAVALDARTAAGMESLVFGWQHQPYGVPWWQDQTPLTGSVPAGSFSIPCVTTDRQFAVGGIAVIWRDEYTFEALTVATVTPTGITVTSPTQFSWNAGLSTLVIPIFLARLAKKVTVDRLWSGGDSMDLEFSGEAQQPAPAPTNALTVYKGYSVLEVGPNWVRELNRTYARSIVELDPKIGPITTVDKGGSAIVGQEFPYWLADHPTVTKFRAFILAQFGQLTPFWIPTWDQDLVLANDVLAADTGIVIQSEFYAQFFFPAKSRQYLAFIPTDGSANVYRKVIAAVDNHNGTETLTLDAAPGKNFPAASTQISFLTLARLSNDETTIEWMTNDLAQANLQIQEVPREVP